MTVAALLDLGADEGVLRKALSKIPDRGFEIEISRVEKNGIDCCDFNVKLDSEHENHDHDMEYLYGHTGHGSDHEHHHENDHEHHNGSDHEHYHEDDHESGEDHIHQHAHSHGHDHGHEGGGGHRSLKDILTIIEGLDLTDGARGLAEKVFRILAEAEAKAHNREIEEVHFHEVGAIDSIVDIVAAAVCFDDLGITDVIIPKLCDGTGTVRCQHGILPVPVPAVMNIAAKYGLPLSITSREGEYVTPTGAAFAAAVMTSDKLPEVFIPERIGLGAGKRAYAEPGILRAVLFRS